MFDKYLKEDDSKLVQLGLQLEKLTTEVTKKKQMLLDEATETQALQMQLNRTSEEYRTLHTERQNLLEQFESMLSW